MQNTNILDQIITGRVEPQIYAFTTQTIPNYLKVGDTYRPLEVRLNEWRKHFPLLVKEFEGFAKVNDDTFFRDFAIHNYLEGDLGKIRLQPSDIKNIPYYSKEFFKDTTRNDVENAIQDIINEYKNNSKKYRYYEFDKSLIPTVHTYLRTQTFTPRPNQQATIVRFQDAISNGRDNLLMYAVMRFGKSFTSMCCAVEMGAKLVVVVSAKADVKEEWKKTVESHIRFDGYSFLDSSGLLQSETILKDKLSSDDKIVLFLTLQDLQGDEIKSKHKELFEAQTKIDLLLIDESHFGARAEEYGKVLKENGLSQSEIKNEAKLADDSLEGIDYIEKTLLSKIKIHLSGTPYRILMGSEFTKDDIIAFYQFTDIVDDQKEWDQKNLDKDEAKEWDNPYYGFPQMIRFAFNPNESAMRKLEQMKQNGMSYAFSEFFKPYSLIKDATNLSHKKFIHEQEVLDFLKVIDGSESDTNILSFLNYAKIQDGKMCRHIVCVLPYRASCDALEELIKKNNFIHLNDYEILNISGLEASKLYKDTQAVQNEIKKLESENKKTITLTVNRMLTGSTVPEWDTMLFLKDTASPQEYDQAVFRIQNQYVTTYKDDNGDVIKYNMKPQTLLVDFNPNRMFRMQEYKSLIYNVNTDSSGNNELEDRIQKELSISPIITINKDKIVEVTPTDILDAVREYSSTRSVFDEATSIGIDYSLLNIEELKREIDKQAEIGSKQGLEVKASEGEGADLDIDEELDGDGEDGLEKGINKKKDDKEEVDYKAKFAMYYSRILFYSFLTDSEVRSLDDIIYSLKENSDNQHILSNLSLSLDTLNLFRNNVNPFILIDLDRKIFNINSLANDKNIAPIDRASNAMRKFGRLSDSEIVTPEEVTNRIIGLLPKIEITDSTKLLDIASKQGEFVYAFYKQFGKEKTQNFYSIPTSKIAYEFTRKVYSLLELDTDRIETDYTSYDLIKEKELIENNELKFNKQNMKFDVIVGNPPYQESDGGAQASARPIYQQFMDVAKILNPNYISMVMPTRWYAGGKGLDDFRNEMLNDIHISELHDFLKPDLVFQGINLRGGVCFFLRDKKYDNTKSLVNVYTYNNTLTPKLNLRNLKTEDSDIFIRHSVSVDILKKVKSAEDFNSLEEYISSRKPFGLEGNFTKDKRFRETDKGLKEPIICYGKAKQIGYIEKDEITKNTGWIDKWRVYLPYANNIGTELNDDNQNSFVGQPNTVCTETFLVVGADLLLDKISSNNLSKYLQSKFARFMHSLPKISQHGTAKTYVFVPLQDFTSESDIDWTKSVEDIDEQLYKKYNLIDEEITFINEMIKPMN